MILRLHTDGASRGNPGPAGAGVVLERDGVVVAELSAYLGHTTNNVAEYQALLAGLQRALELGASGVEVVSDSELMVRQLQGRYQVRSPSLVPLLREARRLLQRFPDGHRIVHTAREGNARADALANQAIDAALGRPARRLPGQGVAQYAHGRPGEPAGRSRTQGGDAASEESPNSTGQGAG